MTILGWISKDYDTKDCKLIYRVKSDKPVSHREIFSFDDFGSWVTCHSIGCRKIETVYGDTPYSFYEVTGEVTDVHNKVSTPKKTKEWRRIIGIR